MFSEKLDKLDDYLNSRNSTFDSDYYDEDDYDDDYIDNQPMHEAELTLNWMKGLDKAEMLDDAGYAIFAEDEICIKNIDLGLDYDILVVQVRNIPCAILQLTHFGEKYHTPEFIVNGESLRCYHDDFEVKTMQIIEFHADTEEVEFVVPVDFDEETISVDSATITEVAYTYIVESNTLQIETFCGDTLIESHSYILDLSDKAIAKGRLFKNIEAIMSIKNE